MPKYFMSIIEEEAAYGADGAATFDEVMTLHRDFAAAVKQAGGTIESSEALQPMSTALFLRGTPADGSAIDNPLPEAKEVVGGYYLVEAPDDAVALELAKLCPAPYGYIEMRPIWEISAG